MFDLTGKVAVVTGASSGLGVQFAKALARQGADVALLARRKEMLEQTAADINSSGGRTLTIVCDVGDTESIKNAVSEVMRVFGKIDILVNNAGVGIGAPAETMTDEVWDKVLDINLGSVFRVTREFAKEIKNSPSGRIINISSIYGIMGGISASLNYYASKGGIVLLTRAQAASYAKYGITVNAIAPGFFASEMTQEYIDTDATKNLVETRIPLKRIGKPGELDGALVYFASDESAYTTGTLLPVDGGQTSASC